MKSNLLLTILVLAFSCIIPARADDEKKSNEAPAFDPRAIAILNRTVQF